MSLGRNGGPFSPVASATRKAARWPRPKECDKRSVRAGSVPALDSPRQVGGLSDTLHTLGEVIRISGWQRYGSDDRVLVRWFVRTNPRHPSRYVLAVGAVLLAELLPQRGLFLDHHDCKREEPEEHAPHRHPFVAEQQRLAQ